MKQQDTVQLRYMRQGDIPAVVAIDRASFQPPWPPRSYRHEVNESTVSYMAVLERLTQEPVTGLKKIFHNLRGDDGTEEARMIVGYSGLWKIAEEAHVSTIASHPDFRGRSYGEILLAGMIRRAIALEAEYVVLEVRISNHVAQSLYHKYNFEIVGTKKDYYRHDKEDAYDMRLTLTPEAIAHFHTQYHALQSRHPFEDNYSHTPAPRERRNKSKNEEID
jgi:ribosomal-protein-alanine N-acetyltransferase